MVLMPQIQCRHCEPTALFQRLAVMVQLQQYLPLDRQQYLPLYLTHTIRCTCRCACSRQCYCMLRHGPASALTTVAITCQHASCWIQTEHPVWLSAQLLSIESEKPRRVSPCQRPILHECGGVPRYIHLLQRVTKQQQQLVGWLFWPAPVILVKVLIHTSCISRFMECCCYETADVAAPKTIFL